MTPEEAAGRKAHPSGRGGRRPVTEHPALLRVVHNDSHTWGQAASRGPEKADDAAVRPSLLAIFAVTEAAGGVVASVWTGDLRIGVTTTAIFAVLALIGARLERRRPR